MYTYGLLYNIKHVHIMPPEDHRRSAATVLLALHKRLHHFETKSRWDLLVLLSDWIGGPGLEY